MEHVNLQNGVRINLDALTETEKRFYRLALEKFQQNTSWLGFDQFAFGMNSPIFFRQRSHLDVLKHPLYLALKDMSLQLGVQQGKIARRKAKVEEVSA